MQQNQTGKYVATIDLGGGDGGINTVACSNSIEGGTPPGVSVLNSMVLVTFIRQLFSRGVPLDVAIGEAALTRLRPVLMTASAMILGMVPMALGIGEGGEQNAPLGRAVIGGLLFATFATLIFVPTMYRLLRRRPAAVLDSSAIGRANATA